MDVICRGQCRMKTWASFTKYSEFPDGDHRGGSKGNSYMVPVKPAPWGLHVRPPPSITRDGPAHPRPPGRDPNSKLKVRSLLSMHHLHAIINLKNPQFNPPKLGTACTCNGGCKRDQGPGGSAGGAPRRPGWPGDVEGEMWERGWALESRWAGLWAVREQKCWSSA